MSAKIINLRTERKRRDRAADADRAAENRTRHGRTKEERSRDDRERDIAERAHDGHRIEADPDRSDPV